MTILNSTEDGFGLRVEGFPTENNESADDVLNKVRTLIKDSNVEIPDTVIDRAHRIGSRYKDRLTNQEHQSIIVRFTTFRHKNYVIQCEIEENKANANVGIRIRLDLTKKRYAILLEARKTVEENPYVDYVLADVNCRLNVKLKSGEHLFFNLLMI